MPETYHVKGINDPVFYGFVNRYNQIWMDIKQYKRSKDRAKLLNKHKVSKSSEESQDE